MVAICKMDFFWGKGAGQGDLFNRWILNLAVFLFPIFGLGVFKNQ